jgi:hypothetical protein
LRLGYPITGPSWENPAATKKTPEKALIPLPPTSFASVVFANTGGDVNDAPAKAL